MFKVYSKIKHYRHSCYDLPLSLLPPPNIWERVILDFIVKDTLSTLKCFSAQFDVVSDVTSFCTLQTAFTCSPLKDPGAFYIRQDIPCFLEGYLYSRCLKAKLYV